MVSRLKWIGPALTGVVSAECKAVDGAAESGVGSAIVVIAFPALPGLTART